MKVVIAPEGLRRDTNNHFSKKWSEVMGRKGYIISHDSLWMKNSDLSDGYYILRNDQLLVRLVEQAKKDNENYSEWLEVVDVPLGKQFVIVYDSDEWNGKSEEIKFLEDFFWYKS